VRSLVTGLPLDLRFRTKGQLGIDVLGTLTPTGWLGLRLRGRGPRQLHRAAGVPGGPRAGLRAASRVVLPLRARPGTRMTCADVVKEAREGQQGQGGPLGPAGSSGHAATRHDPDGSTNAHAWHVTMPWSASNWLLRTRHGLGSRAGQSRMLTPLPDTRIESQCLSVGRAPCRSNLGGTGGESCNRAFG
jgi:hypothetical protein